jgi:hypothetical protein
MLQNTKLRLPGVDASIINKIYFKITNNLGIFFRCTSAHKFLAKNDIFCDLKNVVPHKI